MDIHKPKPWHGVRGFLKEYAIIVIGVLTALAGEQAVEKLHDRARADEARISIHGEIADNLARMNLRQVKEGCMIRRLDEIDGLIANYARSVVPPEVVWIGAPFTYLMHDSKYKAAIQSGAVSLFDDGEQAVYADLYAIFTLYGSEGTNEWRIWDDLRTLEKRPPYSATLDWQLRSAMQHARTARFDIALGRQIALREGADLGISPADLKEDTAITACLPLSTTRAEADRLAAKFGVTLPIP